MGKASSAKKVARAARAGGSHRPGQRRQLGFPALIAVIVITGVGLVVFARTNREANASPRSQANEVSDHWHAALGLYQCDAFVLDGSPEGGAYLADLAGDPLGIHTHDDGVIHIHPFTDAAGGRNARMRLFFQDVGIEATNTRVTFADGRVWEEGVTTCGEGDDAEDGQIVLARWNSAQDAADGERPSELITEDFGDVRFRADREYFTFAFLPVGPIEDVPVRPDVIESLSNLSDVIEADGSTTETTVAGEDGSTTTAPSDPSTTTTVPSG